MDLIKLLILSWMLRCLAMVLQAAAARSAALDHPGNVAISHAPWTDRWQVFYGAFSQYVASASERRPGSARGQPTAGAPLPSRNGGQLSATLALPASFPAACRAPSALDVANGAIREPRLGTPAKRRVAEAPLQQRLGCADAASRQDAGAARAASSAAARQHRGAGIVSLGACGPSARAPIRSLQFPERMENQTASSGVLSCVSRATELGYIQKPPRHRSNATGPLCRYNVATDADGAIVFGSGHNAARCDVAPDLATGGQGSNFEVDLVAGNSCWWNIMNGVSPWLSLVFPVSPSLSDP
eukprot:scaffold7033_cov257-Pinguiococcus_pyrenoidosus.AAC.10